MSGVKLRASIVGASGYGGGEVLRLLLDHPCVEVLQATSRRHAGAYVPSVHPNLRGRTRLQFSTPEEVSACDVLFLAMPHGEASRGMERWSGLSSRVIDLSADFRLRDRGAYRRWYGEDHPSPEWLDRFVYGLPEFHRDRLRGARLASGVGCNATAVNLAIMPLVRAGLVERVIADVKVGSSEAGDAPSPSGHHPERSGVIRTYAASGHRHEGEVRQELGEGFGLHMTVTSVDVVRGVLCTAHVLTTRAVEEREVWRLYRSAYESEPFVRVVKDRAGLHRCPEPKVVAGTNYADVGFEVEEGGRRVVALSAIDNLMKGAAGSAVQCMNLMCGFEEEAGLGFAGLHPC